MGDELDALLLSRRLDDDDINVVLGDDKDHDREHDHKHFIHVAQLGLNVRDHIRTMQERHNNQLGALDQRNKELVEQSAIFGR